MTSSTSIPGWRQPTKTLSSLSRYVYVEICASQTEREIVKEVTVRERRKRETKQYVYMYMYKCISCRRMQYTHTYIYTHDTKKPLQRRPPCVLEFTCVWERGLHTRCSSID